VPPEIQHWNWGAEIFGSIWVIAHGLLQFFRRDTVMGVGLLSKLGPWPPSWPEIPRWRRVAFNAPRDSGR
jgi:hypothetical protein